MALVENVRGPAIAANLNAAVERVRVEVPFRRHTATIQRTPGRHGAAQFAKFVPTSSVPSLGTRTHGSMAG